MDQMVYFHMWVIMNMITANTFLENDNKYQNQKSLHTIKGLGHRTISYMYESEF